MRSSISRLALTDFRSYDRAELAPGGASVFLFGPNGAGKTNLLEAVSFLTPGRGLRNAAVVEVGRRAPDERTGRAWSVAAEVELDGEPYRLGTGVETPTAARRTVRLEGETVAPGRLLDLVRPVWLTPAQDRLFLEGRSDRLKFYDRLVFADDAGHAAAVAAYEKALRERTRLLVDGPADPAWLGALEARLGEAGARMASARAATLAALQAEIDARVDRPFPQAALSLSGPFERAAAAGAGYDALAADIAEAMRRSRDRDAAAGRALAGPHRTDLEVVHRERGRPAAECSTGEQKALILNLVLGQAARLSRAKAQPNPILLLDEVAAHLDRSRRAALFDEITALGLQAFLTGTDEALFEDLKGRALGVRVDAGRLTVLD
ncbi:DNA replication/repair protein RecF [Caulobacter sp. 17J80-11]|uniref:DNA replication/repair protein RecF n=1 Tax=Caulobacter sp. 17J80-11 TaxID=2763502 RepID=UPI001653C1C9|nr:DNA replication/repair protein RecF [Caulobacter sp. 17J80-11]MBC6981484.1 DNA replication/repair protein RecF [Caulobacter sp. 17J80-11]